MTESKIALTERLRKEGRWEEASMFKDTALADFRAKGMTRGEASPAAWDAMEKAYPPLAAVDAPADPGAAAANVRVQGLGEIPESWPELPDNASLQAELAWVQSNRLRVVEEKPSGANRVYLDRARSPAPSWAALGWLETSIRSYAKYIDVMAKSLATQQDERELVQRERRAIEDIRGLLAEMVEESPAT